MLAIKLHCSPRPALAKDDWLVPILDWKSGRVQVRQTLKYMRLYSFNRLSMAVRAAMTGRPILSAKFF